MNRQSSSFGSSSAFIWPVVDESHRIFAGRDEGGRFFTGVSSWVGIDE